MNGRYRSFTEDKERADLYWPQIHEILRHFAHLIVDWESTTEQEDMLQAADYRIQAKSGTIAARVRFDGVKYRDLTLRSWRKSGVETELAKIRNGYARWYFYGWATDSVINEWMLIDLDGLRESGALDWKHKPQLNKDGQSAFIAIARTSLKKLGLIVGSQEGQVSMIPLLGQVSVGKAARL